MSMIQYMKEFNEKKGLKFKLHSDYEGLMTIQEWVEDVEGGGLIDYDGHGYLATETETSNVMIWPSEAKDYKFPEWATHIMWYNR